MPDGFIQLPADSSGKKIDTSDLTVGASTSVHRERYVAADPTSATGLATVTSSGGSQVHVTNPSTSVTITNPSTAVNIVNNPTVLTASSGYLIRSLSSGTVTLSSNPTVVLSSIPSLTSGTVTLSSVHTVTATAGTNPWSSAPGFNLPLVSASSGLVQISGGTFLTSGTVTLSSAPSLSSGTVTLSSVHSVTATAATNPWSSAPGFNLPFISASSGLVQISGPTSLSSGTVTLSSAPTVQQGASLISGISSAPWIMDLRNQVYSSVPQYAEVSATSSGHVTLVSAVTSMSIYVLGYALVADSSNTVIWESSNTDLSGPILFSTAGTGLVCPLVGPGQGAWLKTSVGGDLGLLVGNAGTVGGHLTYFTATS